MQTIYFIISILSTIASTLYAVWENKRVKKNRKLIYELQQLSIDSHFNIKLLSLVLEQHNINPTDLSQIKEKIPPVILAEMARYKLEIDLINKPL